ncbi:hypothetical protein [Rubrobacter calidifluminis]|uniref:hypothetical protein n=1 Tax=Rubrobacter calidifluminis TaxID=1392640 RepID=UPI00236099D9|nr:hypothetical protein [Rubrobacter calidifluminis]
MSEERREPYLPPGYRVILSDPEVVQLVAPWGDVIFTWSRWGAAPRKVESLAWDHHRRTRKSAMGKER